MLQNPVTEEEEGDTVKYHPTFLTGATVQPNKVCLDSLGMEWIAGRQVGNLVA